MLKSAYPTTSNFQFSSDWQSTETPYQIKSGPARPHELNSQERRSGFPRNTHSIYPLFSFQGLRNAARCYGSSSSLADGNHLFDGPDSFKDGDGCLSSMADTIHGVPIRPVPSSPNSAVAQLASRTFAKEKQMYDSVRTLLAAVFPDFRVSSAHACRIPIWMLVHQISLFPGLTF